MTKKSVDGINKSILKLDTQPADQAGAGKSRARVVLLQGPVGPFFYRLNKSIEQHGYDVLRICFNAGDRFFSTKKNRTYFCGDLERWRNWFTDFIDDNKIGYVVLFGSERPIHRIARDVAVVKGVRIISLEEGYIRPGYITVENDGNNSDSPLAAKIYPPDYLPAVEETTKPEPFQALLSMAVYAFVYYTLRTFVSLKKQKKLYHRHASIPEFFRWVRNGYRRILHQYANSSTIGRLLKRYDGEYFLVALQVAADCHMQNSSLGWDTNRLISAALESFANHAPANKRLLFKIHPFERGHSDDKKKIMERAKACGVAARVDVIDVGSLGLLAQHASGMITINSSSGLSAIFHGIPLLVIGDALYSNDELAICAHGNPDFDSFWTSKFKASAEKRRTYLSWIKENALVPGDYYNSKGMKIACHGILAKLQTSTTVEDRR